MLKGRGLWNCIRAGFVTRRCDVFVVVRRAVKNVGIIEDWTELNSGWPARLWVQCGL